ncbi:MAG: hypothetical protein GQ553_02595 [Nitrosomonadaceae bacterium]|nr:hypothetical protein [Nitrosomonadaceae bacterium]
MESEPVERKKVLIIEFKSEAIRASYTGLNQSTEHLEVIHVIKPENEANEVIVELKGLWDCASIARLREDLTPIT